MIRHLKNTAFVAISIILMSWGNAGHRKISGNAELSFNAEMQDFHTWVNFLVDHASDADIRKQTDPDEAPRHYIDIDLYDEFQILGTIPQDLDDLIALYGHDFVYDAGVLPWATKVAYDSLVESFKRLDWDTAVYFAADLGHYVADGHMPLHITANFNGQFTGNYDIHSRYESTMINTYGSQIVYEGDSISVIPDVQEYIFDYLYFNYTYVDSVLQADDYAKSINSNTSSSEYKQALWQKTSGFTTMLFHNASHALAELIYTAWAEAGKPKLYTGPFIFTHHLDPLEYLEQNLPNPFRSATTVRFSLPKQSKVTLEVRDMNGNLVETLVSEVRLKGDHRLTWSPADQPEGIYLLVLKMNGSMEVRKMIVMK